MTHSEMLQKCREYREMKRFAEEVKANADALADELKAEMDNIGVEKLIVGEYKLSYSTCSKTTVDGKALQSALPEVYEQYSNTSSYRRFLVS